MMKISKIAAALALMLGLSACGEYVSVPPISHYGFDCSIADPSKSYLRVSYSEELFDVSGKS